MSLALAIIGFVSELAQLAAKAAASRAEDSAQILVDVAAAKERFDAAIAQLDPTLAAHDAQADAAIAAIGTSNASAPK